MSKFELDARLKSDCIVLAESDISLLLLMNNVYYPWLIIVPKTNEIEFSNLPESLQHQLLSQINAVSKLILNEYHADKMNIATIGNIVAQLHIHVVGRFKTDPAWPGVVWGASETKLYKNKQIDLFRHQIQNYISDQFNLVNL